MIIAIDGPAGAGKSTISKQLARQMGFVRVDTGAIYRAVGLAAVRAGLTPEAADLGDFVAHLDLRFEGDALLLDDEDVSAAIRTPEISRAASQFAAVPAVRAALLTLQRRIGEGHDAIFDGRDIGTVVFPDAPAKFFLTASVAERARRRHAELVAAGVDQPYAEVEAEIVARDKADSERAVAPLRKADDAVEIDATSRTVDEVVALCLRIAADRLGL